MKLTLHRIALPLRHRFTISRGSRTFQKAVIVELNEGSITGLGEVTASDYYGFSLESIVRSIESVRPLIEATSCGDPAVMWSTFHKALKGDTFALCALDLAWHDLRGRLLKKPLAELWGLDRRRVPGSSYTIGIDTMDSMVARLREQPGWSCYKIKLGTTQDLDIMKALRKQTDATFRVDANGAWSADEAIEKSAALKQLGVEFIEQPLPPGSPTADHRAVFERSALPVIADESCLVEDDVRACHGLFHGINIKLCKCGGLTPALRMLNQARELGMKTMVGCMVESSVGISASAQLLPLLDYADLDGAVLLRDEPARGVQIKRGTVIWADLPGTGAELLTDRLDEFRIAEQND